MYCHVLRNRIVESSVFHVVISLNILFKLLILLDLISKYGRFPSAQRLRLNCDTKIVHKVAIGMASLALFASYNILKCELQ
jgi:hypothetical protein